MTFLHRVAPFAAAVALAACAGPAAVSPDEIPELEERLARSPDDGALLLRYSAALFAAGECDSATAVAERGMLLTPADAVGPLVMGQCQEQAGNATRALTTYRTFLNNFPDARGAPAVRAREMLALRQQANELAREAIQREDQLRAETADPQAVGVLPLQIAGDSIYRPLSRGLAQILTSDLALLERFRMVERLHLAALYDELDLQQGSRVDPATTVRVGRLIQAGRLVQGLAAIPDEDNVRLDASVVMASGEVTSPASVEGRLRELLRMEKDLVVEIAGNLGYTLSDAERQLILENGTQNLVAFLAYSRGLEAEDLGDYEGAAAFYAQAVRIDPNFQIARSRYQAAQAAPAVQQASANQVTTIAAASVVDVPGEIDPVSDAVETTVTDLVPTLVEQNAMQGSAQGGSTTSTGDDNQSTGGTTGPVVGVIRIVFRLP